MNNHSHNQSRRNFLKNSGIAGLPCLVPTTFLKQGSWNRSPAGEKKAAINFITDMPLRDAGEYLSDLQNALVDQPGAQDFYGGGGIVQSLEKKFAAVSGKEKALFLPTGTMANNLAIRVLAGNNPKVIVQETSHLYRDEADAAQSIHGKRLAPVAMGQCAFTLADLENQIDYFRKSELFKTSIGALSLEIPVRRVDNTVFPFEDLRQICDYCRSNGIKTHLDGARLHIATAYSGVSIKDYCGLFDTVYFSLYKYLGSPGGAVLCGDAGVVEQVRASVRIFGGVLYQSWLYAAIAHKKIDEIETVWKTAREKGEDLFELLAKTGLMKVVRFSYGSNVHQLNVLPRVDFEKMTTWLRKEHNLLLRTPGPQGFIRFFINETLLWRPNAEIAEALAAAIRRSTT